MAVALTVSYGAVAGLIGLVAKDYTKRTPSYLEKVMKTELPSYNGITFRTF